MSNVSVVGLGMMGAALAKTLLEDGREVTVWNRDPEKAKPFESLGARVANSLADAVSMSPIILVCIRDYAATRESFSADEVAAALTGRCIVQLSTGKPRQAIDDQAWFQQLGARYLDGAILAPPVAIGTDEAQILIAGDQPAWQVCQPVLSCLAARLDYTGEQIDSAAILDLAWLGQRLAVYCGVFQAILLCQDAGVDLDVYAATIAPDSRMKAIAATVKAASFDQVINSVSVWNQGLQQVRGQAAQGRCNTETLDFIDDKFRRAAAAGYSEEDMAALIKVFAAAR